MQESLEQKAWWGYIEADLKELLKESQKLSAITSGWEEKFHDYAFVVFPAAKAYEGFLKKLFLDLGLISPEQFYGKRFRVGKALNPSLKKSLREKFGVYYKIITYCGGDSGLADTLWDTWRECRNILFRWIP